MIFSDRTETILHKSKMMLRWMGLKASHSLDVCNVHKPSATCLHLSIESLYRSLESDTPPHRSDHRDLSGGQRGSKGSRFAGKKRAQNRVGFRS